ncbi:hypothetical protein JJC03_04605 [Flavobacterium oreochromis]|uniref:hypothetical protein n=1 Tax=Flavobacterium oreochromis TaxID=2906078 RepID=UPI001CE5F6FC|nr:hypothetical protein [Flavobacterium oreochromis]QYS87224.1 hypothetical protein JJC03_04605 [Flavobacterium oreochromis]
MKINLIEFLKNGFFGNITLGEHRNKIINFFNSINELKDEDYISFNNLELKFFDDELVLISFYLNHSGELFLNDKSRNPFL